MPPTETVVMFCPTFEIQSFNHYLSTFYSINGLFNSLLYEANLEHFRSVLNKLALFACFVKYDSLMPMDLFVTGHLLTLPLVCERAHDWIGETLGRVTKLITSFVVPLITTWC